MQPPASIDWTGKSDVTAALNAWMQSVPDPAVIELPGEYMINGTLLLTKRAYPTITGGGRLFAGTDGTELGATKALTRSHLKLVGCTNPIIDDLDIVGANPTGGSDRKDLEGQHCVYLDACTNPELYDLGLQQAFGDAVYGRSNGLYVHGCTMAFTGRNALSLVTGRDLRVQRNTIGDIGGHILDLETGASHSWKVDGIDVSDNCIGTHGLNLVSARGSYSTVSNVTVRGNQLYDSMQFDVAAGSDPTLRYKAWKVYDNISTWVRNATTPLMKFGHVDGLYVVNNREPLRGTGVPVKLSDCPDAVVDGNRWA